MVKIVSERGGQMLLHEKNYAAELEELCLPLLREVGQDGFFRGHDGARLYYRRFVPRAPRGTVVLVHGYTESAEKYRELAAFFVDAGYAVCLYDQRGHGLSHREVGEGLIHVRHFSDYVKDLSCFLQQVAGDLPAPRFLYAHSMGGAVGALYLEQGGDFFKRVVLSAPMIAPKHGDLPLWLCRLTCRTARLLGRGKRQLLQNKQEGARNFENSAVLSRPRYEAYRAVRQAEPRYQSRGATFAWTGEALGVTARLLRRGAPERIGVPLRLYAAEQDLLVKREAQERFVARVPRGEFVLVPGSKHELFSANDEILHPFLKGLLAYFEEDEK